MTNILIVDDEPDITTVFTMGLEDSGFEVNAFDNPLQHYQASKEAYMILRS